MGRSRVYCTRPANANRQHNTNTVRSIPRASHSRNPLDRTAGVSAYFPRVPDRGPARGPQARDLDR
jgi:hypothetical protein